MIERTVLTLIAGEDLTELLVVKLEGSTNDVVKCGAKEKAYGVCLRSVSDGDPVPVAPFRNATVERVTASEPIAKGDTIYPAANGKVQNTPVDTGHYKVGVAKEAALADGSTFEIIVDTLEVATS
jgi:hypothetical protein